MWGNGNDRENRHPLPARKLIRAVVEKDPIGAGRLVLGVGFPQALAVHPDQRSVFVGVQAGMPRIRFEETEPYRVSPYSKTQLRERMLK